MDQKDLESFLCAEDFEDKIFKRLETRICSILEQDRKERQEEVDLNPVKNPLLWNINAMSVICWKSWDWPRSKFWNDETKRFEKRQKVRPVYSSIQFFIENHLLRYLLCYFPLVLVFFEVNTLVGMTDQGSTIKRMIYGDGVFQSYLWRYSRASQGRDAFRPLLAPNGTHLGMTARILSKRPAEEADRCLADDALMPINAYAWPPGGDPARLARDFWPLVDRVRPDADWLFAHCLPWEYARLCAGVMRAEAAAAAAGAGGAAARAPWGPRQCSLPDPNRHPLMGPEDWDGLGASPAELRASRAGAVAPAGVERAGPARLELAVWVATRNVCDAKTLDAGGDGTFSLFLYSQLHYLYRIGSFVLALCSIVAVMLALCCIVVAIIVGYTASGPGPRAGAPPAPTAGAGAALHRCYVVVGGSSPALCSPAAAPTSPAAVE
jgi:hypothetical protein